MKVLRTMYYFGWLKMNSGKQTDPKILVANKEKYVSLILYVYSGM